MQSPQGEGRIAHPGVAVVPVALASRRLRQGGGGRSHRGPGRHVRQALDGERRALDGIAPAVVRYARAAEPVAPVARGGVEAGGGRLDITWCSKALRPRERAEGPLARAQHSPSTHSVAFDAEGEVGLEANRLAGAGGVSRVAIVADELPLGGRPAVVERGLADELDLDPPVQAFHGADQHVVGVVVSRGPRVRRDVILGLSRSHGEGVPDDEPATRVSSMSSRGGSCRARSCAASDGRFRTARSGTSPPGGRAGCRRRWGHRTRARTTSRSHPDGATSAAVWQFDRKA